MIWNHTVLPSRFKQRDTHQASLRTNYSLAMYVLCSFNNATGDHRSYILLQVPKFWALAHHCLILHIKCARPSPYCKAGLWFIPLISLVYCVGIVRWIRLLKMTTPKLRVLIHHDEAKNLHRSVLLDIYSYSVQNTFESVILSLISTFQKIYSEFAPSWVKFICHRTFASSYLPNLFQSHRFSKHTHSV